MVPGGGGGPGRLRAVLRGDARRALATGGGGCTRRAPTSAPPAALALQELHMRRHGAKTILRLGNAVVQERLVGHPPGDNRLATARVFYLRHLLQPTDLPRLLADVPLVAMPRDELLVLQDTSSIEGPAPEALGLLTPRERRQARKKCVASLLEVHAVGGLGGTLTLRSPADAALRPIVGISAGNWSFLVDNLEYADFVTDEARPPEAPPLFPHYFADTGGRVPTTAEALSQGGVPLGCGRVLNAAAFFRAAVEDVTLWLTAFDVMVANRLAAGHPAGLGWLRAPPIGFDPLHQLPLSGDLLRLLVAAYEHVMATRKFQHLAVVEIPSVDGVPEYAPPRTGANGVRFQSAPAGRDLLDFAGVPPEYVCGVLSPAEVFAIPGNAYAYLSVESMIGNNTDLRYVQSYLHNPHLLAAANHVPVDAADTVPK